MPLIKYFKIGLLTIVVNGCAISDPNRGGLIGGIMGLGLGRYPQGEEELEAELAKTKSEARRANQQMELSTIEVERKNRELVELREEVDRTIEKTRGFAVIPPQIIHNQDDNFDIQRVKEDLVRRMQALNVRVSQLQQQATPTLANPTTTGDWNKVQFLREEVQKINAELEALWDIANKLH